MARATTGVFRKLSKLSGKMVNTEMFMGSPLFLPSSITQKKSLPK